MKTLCFVPLKSVPCFSRKIDLLAGITSMSLAHFDKNEMLIFRLVGNSFLYFNEVLSNCILKKHTVQKSLLFGGEGGREKVLRKFFKLKYMLCICN